MSNAQRHIWMSWQPHKCQEGWVSQDIPGQRRLRQQPARPWNDSSHVRGRGAFCGVKQPRAHPSSISQALGPGHITKLLHTSVSSFAIRISPLSCFSYDRVFRLAGDNNSIYTSLGSCEGRWRLWKERAWHITRSQKMWLFNYSWQTGGQAGTRGVMY